MLQEPDFSFIYGRVVTQSLCQKCEEENPLRELVVRLETPRRRKS